MKHLLYLSKMMEECGEVIQAASKVLIHGEDNTHPIDNKETNLERLQSEMEDVLAIFAVISTEYKLDSYTMGENIPKKVEKIVTVVERALEEAIAIKEAVDSEEKAEANTTEEGQEDEAVEEAVAEDNLKKVYPH